jgi:hypothetical protein
VPTPTQSLLSRIKKIIINIVVPAGVVYADKNALLEMQANNPPCSTRRPLMGHGLHGMPTLWGDRMKKKICQNCNTEIRFRTKEEMPQCKWIHKVVVINKKTGKKYTNCECGQCLIGWF